MSREWKPGDVARHKAANGTTVIYIRTKSAWNGVDEFGETYTDRHISNPRPLVVIDPEDREQMRRIAECAADGDAAEWRVDMWQRYFRSLITPPKPEEPTGKWAVVEDAGGRCLIRSAWANERPWNVLGTGDYLDYTDITAVRVLSKGIS